MILMILMTLIREHENVVAEHVRRHEMQTESHLAAQVIKVRVVRLIILYQEHSC